MKTLTIKKLIEVALECSIYVAPTDWGLSIHELEIIGGRFDFGKGEVGDAMKTSGVFYGPRIRLSKISVQLDGFTVPPDPDFRSLPAYTFIWEQLQSLARELGRSQARLPRNVLVERAVHEGLNERDVQAALTILLEVRHLVEHDELIGNASNRHDYISPEAQMAQLASSPVMRNRSADPHRQSIFEAVRDVIDRRTDGRPTAINAFDAFAERLDDLGYGVFRLWWNQTVGEVRRLDPKSTPTSATVMAAALLEAALTFVVRHAQQNDLAPFRSSTFKGQPRTWKLDKLVASAASGGAESLLSPELKGRADHLFKTRQRIHAGRMLEEYPKGVPDLRPEEAIDAKNTAELVVRAVLDWLDRFPAKS